MMDRVVVIYLRIITIIAAFAFLGLFALFLLRFAFGLFGATIVSAAAALLLPLFATTAATGREELQSNLAINVNSFECTPVHQHCAHVSIKRLQKASTAAESIAEVLQCSQAYSKGSAST